MTSPSVTTEFDTQEPIDALPYLPIVVRGALLGVAVFLTVIFSIAIYLNPYNADGSAKRQATHRGLGLPPCTFYEQTGLPCPSCGMTTSFALLVRGDVWHSVQANSAGTMLATVCLLAIPWSLASLWKQRLLYVRSFETMFTIFIASFMGVMLLRWAVVIGIKYFFNREVWM
jgi:Protein of unknown function (DUF2752)